VLLTLFLTSVKVIYACSEILEMETNLTVIRLNFFVGVLMILSFTIEYGGKQIVLLIGALRDDET